MIAGCAVDVVKKNELVRRFGLTALGTLAMRTEYKTVRDFAW